jgi:glycerol-3-phosphate acyltransferase PlsY
MISPPLYLLVSFLIGSLPFGEIASRLKTGKTLIKPGTRTTRPPKDMFAFLGIPLGLLVCILDIFKGFIVVFPLAQYFLGPDPYFNWGWISLAGLLCVIGHCNSIFLSFKGGRGLAPTFGVMVTLLPGPATLAFFLGFFLAFWGLSSKPGALSAAGAMPLLSIIWVVKIKPEDLFYLYIVAFMSLWTFWEHRDELKNYLGLNSSNSNEAQCQASDDTNPDEPESASNKNNSDTKIN